jgi:hypothetical protein
MMTQHGMPLARIRAILAAPLAFAATVLTLSASSPALAGQASTAVSEMGSGRDLSRMTLKERAAGKAMDEQRLDDCKVPFDLRGDHHRSAACRPRPAADTAPTDGQPNVR